MSVLSGAVKVAGVGLNIGVPTYQAYGDMKEGKGVIRSVTKAGVDWAIGDAMMGFLGMGPGLALMVGTGVVAGADAAIKAGQGYARNAKKAFSGTGVMGVGLINDSDYAATMRQRQLQQMGGHQGIARQSLGSEARRRASNVRY